MNIPTLQLATGATIPQIGLGLWKVRSAEEFNAGFAAALTAGYRHFDSAQAYDNEQLLGAAWKASGISRQELFITTKIAVQNFGRSRSKEAFKESLEKLQTNYVDLLLLHFPVTGLRKRTWQALEDIQASNQAKAIGVSNFTIRHLEQMNNYASIKPAVNQVELHVFLQQPELVAYCQDHNITIEAYSPLAHARDMNDSVVTEIAKKHNKSYAQIMLRWLVEQDFVVLPKSVNPKRIEENCNIFDFRFDATDLERLAALDKDMRTCWSPVHVP